MSELTPHARALLEDARAARCAPDPEAVARIEKAVLASTAGVAVGFAGTKLATTWSAAIAGKAGLVSLLVVSVAVGGATAAWVRAASTPAPAARAHEAGGHISPVLERSARPVEQPTSALTPAPSPPALVLLPATAPPKSLPVPRPPRELPQPEQRSSVASAPVEVPTSAPSPPGTESASRLAVELALLRSARVALDAHDWEAGLRLLEQHDAEFADGALRVESDVLRVLAWCGLGRTDDASRLAAALSGAGSPAKVRLRGSCVDP